MVCIYCQCTWSIHSAASIAAFTVLALVCIICPLHPAISWGLVAVETSRGLVNSRPEVSMRRKKQCPHWSHHFVLVFIGWKSKFTTSVLCTWSSKAHITWPLDLTPLSIPLCTLPLQLIYCLYESLKLTLLVVIFSSARVKFGVPLDQVCMTYNDIPAPLLILILKLNKEAPAKKDVFRAPGHQANMKKLIQVLQVWFLCAILSTIYCLHY